MRGAINTDRGSGVAYIRKLYIYYIYTNLHTGSKGTSSTCELIIYQFRLWSTIKNRLIKKSQLDCLYDLIAFCLVDRGWEIPMKTAIPAVHETYGQNITKADCLFIDATWRTLRTDGVYLLSICLDAYVKAAGV